MKEFSIEEKAKRYDEAIKKAKSKIKDDKDHVLYEDDVIEIFPELAKSEGKMIIKKIIATIHLYYGEPLEDEAKEMIAWLEKQVEQKHQYISRPKYIGEEELLGEQNHTDKVETKFKIGDVIVEIKPNGYCQPVRVKYVGKESYSCESDDGKRFLFFPIISQDEYELVKQVSVWSEEDENHVKSILSTIECCKAQFPNAQAVVEAYNADIEWFKNLKDRVQPQSQWIPSDEQMASIRQAVSNMKNSACYDSELVHLLQDLEKLRRE